LIDSHGTIAKDGSRREKLAVVVKVMNANFEPMMLQFVDKSARDVVVAFGNEIKARAEAQLHLESHEFHASLESGAAFNVVGQNKPEPFALRPPLPVFGRSFRTWTNGPSVSETRALSHRKPPADLHPDGPWNYGLDPVVESAVKHATILR